MDKKAITNTCFGHATGTGRLSESTDLERVVPTRTRAVDRRAGVGDAIPQFTEEVGEEIVDVHSTSGCN